MVVHEVDLGFIQEMVRDTVRRLRQVGQISADDRVVDVHVTVWTSTNGCASIILARGEPIPVEWHSTDDNLTRH